ncbi:DUF1353 domain-containing protein [Antarctobacter jejuensis]|uniref:DUF1353 domain-containing protein n=1 Tax=Antarctobacter jejuensis TaxID=1439938 RepID=UPI003FD35492
MRIFCISFVGALALVGCGTVGPKPKADEPEISCFTQPQGGCSFSQSPLQVLNEPVELPRRPYKFFPIAAPLSFVDATGRDWRAPARTLTDGASIPAIFVRIVGDPTSPEFINAAAVHDAYCGVGNEAGSMFHRAPWEDVHVMFYNGLIVGGTDHIRAKIMFAAVWLGGPRWRDPVGAVISTQGHTDALASGYVNQLDYVPVWRKQVEMARVKGYIERNEPTLPQLIAYLRRVEAAMLREFPFTHYPDDEAVPRGTGGVTGPGPGGGGTTTATPIGTPVTVSRF